MNKSYCIYQITPELQENKGTKWKCEDCKTGQENILCRYYSRISIERLRFMFNGNYLEKRLLQVG